MGWRDCAYVFYTYTNCINDLEFLQILCDEFSWHLYAEENRKGANYMISGKTFVIDIFYERDEEEDILEEDKDTQSMGSSVIQIGKERVESVYRVIKKVDISLIEEEWSSYFKICTYSVMLHLKKKEYYNVYRLMKNIQKYDTEDEDGFGSIVQKIKKISEGGKRQADYSFLLHKPVVYHKVDTKSPLYDALGMFSSVEEDGLYRIYNRIVKDSGEIDEIGKKLCLNVIIEMMIYNIEIVLDDNIVIPGRIDEKEKRIEVTLDGYVLVDGEIDKYRSLLLKRTESMAHVIRETEIEVNEYKE